ncbi:unnamed protein product [Withania somnifera]
MAHATSSILQLSSSINGETESLSSSYQLRGNHPFHLLNRMYGECELCGSTTATRRPPFRRGRVSPRLPVPDDIPKPPYVGSRELPEISSEHQIHDAEGIARMRAACELAAGAVDYAGTLVRPSVTTNEIDKAVHQMITSLSISLRLWWCSKERDGDIINIDVTVYLNGYHGDTSKTFFCGDVSESIKLLVKLRYANTHSVSICLSYFLFLVSFEKKASFLILETLYEHAEKFGYDVVDRFIGHGIGTVFHSELLIFHHRNDKQGSMVEGQTFTIEPILTLGSTECVTWEDNWTPLTADGSPAAQFEHTILITKTGAEILTTY